MADNLRYWRCPGVTSLLGNLGDTVDLRWAFQWLGHNQGCGIGPIH